MPEPTINQIKTKCLEFSQEKLQDGEVAVEKTKDVSQPTYKITIQPESGTGQTFHLTFDLVDGDNCQTWKVKLYAAMDQSGVGAPIRAQS
jgi:hypothetical protein